MLIAPLGSQAVTTSNATLGSAVPTGQIWVVEAVNIQQPTGSAAKVISMAIGTTATAANIKRRYSVAAGLAQAQDYPRIALVAGEQLNVICDAGTGEAVMTVTVRKQFGTS